jgi:hypothetical protein
MVEDLLDLIGLFVEYKFPCSRSVVRGPDMEFALFARARIHFSDIGQRHLDAGDVWWVKDLQRASRNGWRRGRAWNPCLAAVHNPRQGRAFSCGDGNRSRESEPNAANRRIAELLGPS